VDRFPAGFQGGMPSKPIDGWNKDMFFLKEIEEISSKVIVCHVIRETSKDIEGYRKCWPTCVK